MPARAVGTRFDVRGEARRHRVQIFEHRAERRRRGDRRPGEHEWLAEELADLDRARERVADRARGAVPETRLGFRLEAGDALREVERLREVAGLDGPGVQPVLLRSVVQRGEVHHLREVGLREELHRVHVFVTHAQREVHDAGCVLGSRAARRPDDRARRDGLADAHRDGREERHRRLQHRRRARPRRAACRRPRRRRRPARHPRRAPACPARRRGRHRDGLRRSGPSAPRTGGRPAPATGRVQDADASADARPADSTATHTSATSNTIATNGERVPIGRPPGRAWAAGRGSEGGSGGDRTRRSGSCQARFLRASATCRAMPQGRRRPLLRRGDQRVEFVSTAILRIVDGRIAEAIDVIGVAELMARLTAP